ncbi:lysozyme [Mesorhizobium sp. CAU 1732]|uniref:lysozyme n=1 Tax=Mesorhizobium sp. CAU 1732 TaxID=3140358 RepID=UPI003261D2A6
MSKIKTAAGALTALGILAAAFVGGWEGKRNAAYQDIVGVWTVCYGETRGVKRGDRYTDAECTAMLGQGLAEFETGMRKCLKAPDAIPGKSYAMFLSLSYNIGTGAFCRSTVARRANAGDIVGACNAIPLWNKAGGRVVKGLVNRRAAEQRICLEGARG